MAVEPECQGSYHILDNLVQWLRRSSTAKVEAPWTERGIVDFTVVDPYHCENPHITLGLGFADVAIVDGHRAVLIQLGVSIPQRCVRWRNALHTHISPAFPLSRYEHCGGPAQQLLSLFHDIAVSVHESPNTSNQVRS